MASGRVFWSFSSYLLKYRLLLAASVMGAFAAAIGFGVGIGLIQPALHLLLGAGPATSSGPGLGVYQLLDWLLGAISGDRLTKFLVLVGVGYAFNLFGGAGRFVHGFGVNKAIALAALELRNRLFRRLVRIPMLNLMDVGTGDQQSRILYDVTLLLDGYRTILDRVGGSILKAAAALMVALAVDWKLTVVVLVSVPPGLLLLRRFNSLISRESRRALEGYGRLLAVAQVSLANLALIKTLNAEEHQERQFRKASTETYRNELALGRAAAASSPVLDALMLGGLAVAAGFAAWFVFSRQVDPAGFVAVIVALVAAAQGLRPLADILNQVARSDAAARRVREALDLPPERNLAFDETALPSLKRHSRDIVFERVSFVFPERSRPAVDDVSLRIAFGTVTAFVGANGAGKTTLLGLLPALYPCTRGRVLIDGVDTSSVNLVSLRRQIGFVPQESTLFDSSIAENIALGSKGTSLTAVESAARAACAHEFIVKLPNGYDTRLGEYGSGLSVGQKQRIALARAIFRDPAILILDEPTSQIDSDSAERIRDSLGQIRRGRTIFLNSHRMQLVREADSIVVLDSGRIMDMGEPRVLFERCELYRALIEKEEAALA